MSNSTNTSNAKKNSWLEIFAICAAIAIIFLIWFFYPTFVQNRDEPIQVTPPSIVIPYKHPQPVEVSKQETEFQKFGDTYGTYGDSYGSLNTLFSGLAFAILIISLFMQRQELQAQRQELEAQRNEIKESNNIAEGQRVITEQQAELIQQQIYDAKVQNFYNTLFKFLEEKQRKIALLALHSSNITVGEKVLDRFTTNFRHRYAIKYPNITSLHSVEREEIYTFYDESFILAKESIYDQISENEIIEYIKFILSYIEENEGLNVTRNAINIFISYQSFHEMFCMFIYSEKNEPLKNLVNKYALLRKINTYENKYTNMLISKIADQESYTV